jgi:hypothetical protein
MPSSKNYVRDSKQEGKTAEARGEQGTGSNSGSAIRHRARREAIKLGMIKAGSPKDIDHKRPLSQGGAKLAPSNLRAESKHANRSYPRTSKGAVRKP